MKILSYNIQAACGGNKTHLSIRNYLKSNGEILDKMIHQIKEYNADILGLTEVDAGSFRSHNQIQHMAEKLKYNSASACKYGKAAKLPLFRHQHLAILTKHKILEVKEHRFSLGFKRLALEAVLQIGKQKISVIVTHLSIGKNSRKKQIEELQKLTKKIKYPTMLLGDFNQDNLEFENMKSCITTQTFPSWKPIKQFDYIFVNKNAKVKTASAPQWQFSDHLPIFAEIEI